MRHGRPPISLVVSKVQRWGNKVGFESGRYVWNRSLRLAHRKPSSRAVPYLHWRDARHSRVRAKSWRNSIVLAFMFIARQDCIHLIFTRWAGFNTFCCSFLLVLAGGRNAVWCGFRQDVLQVKWDAVTGTPCHRGRASGLPTGYPVRNANVCLTYAHILCWRKYKTRRIVARVWLKAFECLSLNNGRHTASIGALPEIGTKAWSTVLSVSLRHIRMGPSFAVFSSLCPSHRRDRRP